MKLRNKSGLIAAIAGLAAVSMFSVGFAAWVLSATDEATVGGSISVDTVDESGVYTFEAAPAFDDASIVFGTPTAAQISAYGLPASPAPWLTVTGSVNEKLTATLSIKVKNVASLADAKAHIVIGSLTETTGKYADALSDNLVAALPAPTANDLTWNDSTSSAELVITFAWGSAFNGENPYKYYNSMANTPANAADAAEKLTALEDLQGAAYTLQISTVA